ncbi:protein Eaa [Citrobacter freundii]|uniref:protein Eaa n=1 Tax=Citrobacter freundii TaxID=546 RepID=UPI00374EF2F0
MRSLAQLISDLATQLEVQLVRGNEQAVQLANAESKCRELAAENAGLKAAFGAEPVGEVVLGEYDDCGSYSDARVVCIAADGQADWENFKDGTRLYAVNPAQVSIDERAAFNAWNNDENLPIAGVGAKNAAWLAWQARATMLSVVR